MGSFDGLSVALSGLYAQRRSMDVAAQNVANVSTPGYTRQRVDLAAVGPAAVAGIWSRAGDSSSGVSVVAVTRIQDGLLEAQARDAHAVSADLGASADALTKIEGLFVEPSDTGLGAQLSSMWSSFQDVANQPSDTGVRSAVLQKAGIVTDWLHQAVSQLASQSTGTTSAISTLVSQVNTSASQLAALNTAILRASQTGEPTNELADQRDQLSLKLAELTGGTATSDASGNVNIRVGGGELIAGASARAMQVVTSGATISVQWASGGTPVSVPSGQLHGLLDAVNVAIPAWNARLDQFASSLATQVNSLHQTGYDLNGTLGGAFFTGTTAASINVAITDPRAVAASSKAPTAGVPSLDAGVADALGVLGAAATAPDAVYRQLVSDLGIAAQSVANRADTQTAIVTNVDSARQSVSGVSTDQEMTSIVAFQRAYEACGRVMTAVDSALDTLINHTGLVGRA